MNLKQRAKWERTRVKGIWRFVLLYGVLFWGGLMIVVASVYRMIVGTFVVNNLKLTVPIFLVCGFVFGVALWLVGEYMYRKSSSDDSSGDRRSP
jgi:Ni/Fe-hydrogenase subunit HybB-like protein